MQINIIMAESLTNIVIKLLEAKVLGKATASFVVVYGTIKFIEDGNMLINSTGETVLVLLMGAAAGFLFKACMD